MSDWNAELKAKMRKLVADKGDPVEFSSDSYSTTYNGGVSSYGWKHHEAIAHCRQWGDKCHWVIPASATLEERTYSLFQDTFTDNKDEVGINVYPCHCRCGKYTDITLRYVASLGETIRELTADHDGIVRHKL